MADTHKLARLGFALATIACILAFSVAALEYHRRGEVAPAQIGGGLMMLALAIISWQASRRRPDA